MSTGGNLISDTAHAIEALIVNGEYSSGDKLTEKALVERLGVSRGTVREALRKLESAGLLDIHGNRGAYVRTHSIREVLEIFDLRCELTGYAARLLADLGEAEPISELERLLEEMEETVRSGDGKQYYTQNLAFHDALMRGSGNKRAADLYASLVREAHLHRPMQFSSPPALQRSHREHRQILDAVREGNAKQAEAIARAHVLNGKMRFISSFGGKG
jgi:DNA-binding GntR family transcriptional regulator